MEQSTEEVQYYPPNFFNVLMSGIHNLSMDKDTNAIFINRDPTHFHCILNYLRSQGHSKDFVLPKDSYALECLFIEARFYMLEGLMEIIERISPNIKQNYCRD